MQLSEICAALTKQKLFYGANPEVVIECAKTVEYRLVTEGSTIVSHGEKPSAVLVILSGQVRVGMIKSQPLVGEQKLEGNVRDVQLLCCYFPPYPPWRCIALQVSVRIQSEGQTSILIHNLEAGDHFGDAALIDADLPLHLETYTADSRCEILVIPPETFELHLRRKCFEALKARCLLLKKGKIFQVKGR